jgi:aminoglycoside phosphotransferase (APT) family kinase protein
LFEKNAAKTCDRKLREGTYEFPSPEGDLIITRPLADQVVRLLGLSDGKVGVAEAISSLHPPVIHDAPSTELLRAIEKGTLIWHLCGKFVVRLDENIAVKFAYAMDVNDAVAMEHIKSHAPDMAIPVPFGVASVGAFNYVFMSFVDGVSLDKLWPSLTIPLKQSVQAKLTTIMHQLRALPLPSGPALGSGEPRRCKDMRRTSRICSEEIQTEEALNDFLTTDPERQFCPLWMQMVRSRLRSDHKMVMTHSDLRDANIMVEQKTPDSIQITGLVDWGSSGVYPEYWEYVKACSGLRATSKSDWFDYLPVEAIGHYVDEYMIDIMIDRIHM